MRSFMFLLFIVAGVGIILIALGIVAIVTPSWLQINVYLNNGSDIIPVEYSLFKRCDPVSFLNETSCMSIKEFKKPQIIAILGFCILIIGIILSVVLTGFINKPIMNYLSCVIPGIGSLLIFVGLLIYSRLTMENFGTDLQLKVDLGFSMIFVQVAAILGYVISMLLAFSSGYLHRDTQPTVSVKQ